MAQKNGPKRLTDDQRLQRWMEWYDRNQQKSEYRRNRYAMLTEEEREEIRARRKELYAQRIKDGWADPSRQRRVDIIEYRRLLIAVLLQRDGSICCLCGKEIAAGDESPDHILPKAIGGQDTAENIRIVHRVCNNRRPKKPADMRREMELTQMDKGALN